LAVTSSSCGDGRGLGGQGGGGGIRGRRGQEQVQQEHHHHHSHEHHHHLHHQHHQQQQQGEDERQQQLEVAGGRDPGGFEANKAAAIVQRGSSTRSQSRGGLAADVVVAADGGRVGRADGANITASGKVAVAGGGVSSDDVLQHLSISALADGLIACVATGGGSVASSAVASAAGTAGGGRGSTAAGSSSLSGQVLGGSSRAEGVATRGHPAAAAAAGGGGKGGGISGASAGVGALRVSSGQLPQDQPVSFGAAAGGGVGSGGDGGILSGSTSSNWPCFKAGASKVVAGLEARFVPGLNEGAVVQHVLQLIADSLDAWSTRQYDFYQRVLNGIL
jgi:hypothetical protein